MPGMALRDDRVLRYVSAYCPHCHHERPDRPLAQVRRLGGYLSADPDGRVWLVRGCPDHGMVRTLYDESAEILGYLEQWTAPTKCHTPDLFGNFDQCAPFCAAQAWPALARQKLSERAGQAIRLEPAL